MAALLGGVVADATLLENIATELLRQVQSGLEVESLRPLLVSPYQTSVQAAAWILSELGDLACVLLPEIEDLLDSPIRSVRFFALDSVLLCATPDDASTLLKAVSLIEDPDQAVRWKVLRFLSQATPEQLAAAASRGGSTSLARRIYLLSKLSAADAADVTKDLLSPDRTTRLTAAVAARRLAVADGSLLSQAQRSQDEDVRGFAEDEIRLLNIAVPPGRQH